MYVMGPMPTKLIGRVNSVHTYIIYYPEYVVSYLLRNKSEVVKIIS